MTPDQARHLLGGLSAGILTAEEKNALFEAALHDQKLFDEVAGELEFGAFLESPFTRAQLANRIDVGEERESLQELVSARRIASAPTPAQAPRKPRWKLRPAWLALSGALAASVVVYFAIPQRRVEVAIEKPPAPVAPAPPAVARDSQPAVAKPQAKAFRPVVRQAPAPRPKPPADAPVAEPGQMAMSPRAFSRMAPAAAQLAMPSLTGVVHDAMGAAIPNAVINVSSADGATTTTRANDRGQFMASSLAPGQYKVSISAPGFRQEQREVTLGPDHPAQVDVALLVGDAAESVTVAAAAAPVPTLPQVAVLDFVNREPQGQSGANVADLVATKLKDSGQVAVVDRNKVRQLQKTSAGDGAGAEPSLQQAAAVGRKVGADAVVVGSVQAPGSVKAEVIDTKKAAPVATVEATAASLQLAANSLSSQIQSNLAKAEGRVTGRKGDVVTIRFDAPPAFQTGVRGDVFHNGARIGTVAISGIDGLSATGTYQGSGHPRSGDRVRIPSVP